MACSGQAPSRASRRTESDGANGLSAHLAVAVSIGSTLSQQRHLTSVSNGPRWVCRTSRAPKDREVWDIERKERRRAQRQQPEPTAATTRSTPPSFIAYFPLKRPTRTSSEPQVRYPGYFDRCHLRPCSIPECPCGAAFLRVSGVLRDAVGAHLFSLEAIAHSGSPFRSGNIPRSIPTDDNCALRVASLLLRGRGPRST